MSEQVFIGEQGPELIWWWSTQHEEPMDIWDELKLKHRRMREATIADKYQKKAWLFWFMWCLVRALD